MMNQTVNSNAILRKQTPNPPVVRSPSDRGARGTVYTHLYTYTLTHTLIHIHALVHTLIHSFTHTLILSKQEPEVLYTLIYTLTHTLIHIHALVHILINLCTCTRLYIHSFTLTL